MAGEGWLFQSRVRRLRFDSNKKLYTPIAIRRSFLSGVLYFEM